MQPPQHVGMVNGTWAAPYPTPTAVSFCVSPPLTHKHMLSHIDKQTLVGNNKPPPITPAILLHLLQPRWQQNTQRAAWCSSLSSPLSFCS